jgi:hypothetical protein
LFSVRVYSFNTPDGLDKAAIQEFTSEFSMSSGIESGKISSMTVVETENVAQPSEKQRGSVIRFSVATNPSDDTQHLSVVITQSILGMDAKWQVDSVSVSTNTSVRAGFDCADNLDGSSTIDQCGVCNGGNECLDCFGTPFGEYSNDVCGICGGTTTDSSLCSAVAECHDDASFVDEEGFSCASWMGFSCLNATTDYGYSTQGYLDLIASCKYSCQLCTGSCRDNPDFVDERGYFCSEWMGFSCQAAIDYWGYSEDILTECQLSCQLCTPSNSTENNGKSDANNNTAIVVGVLVGVGGAGLISLAIYRIRRRRAERAPVKIISTIPMSEMSSGRTTVTTRPQPTTIV